MDPSMERIVPDQLDLEDSFDKLSYELHLERYRFASRLLPAGRILDMACGAGYGTYGLASLEKFRQSLFTGNPFHLSDFSEQGFRKLFPLQLFTETEKLLQVQPYALSGVMGSKKNKRISGIRNHLLKFYLIHPRLFFMRLVSLVKNGFTNKYFTLALERKI